ncbi:MAG: hypothetical protein RLY30_1686 [Pseudomonadota bacterium]|jgi:4-diphosphocytidyl-2-C-methyl-D-erythritol kinase
MMRLSAPAKLNLFLHVTGRRQDGYHLLQSVFCLIDWSDEIILSPRSDGTICRLGSYDWPAESDLTVRAALALKAWAVAQGIQNAHQLGCAIQTEKTIPAGAGLGGGSSDAASCLIGLRALWNLPLDRLTLQAMALELGADVPFFLVGGAALAEGVGEVLRPLTLRSDWFVVAVPEVHVPTASIFRDSGLTRDQRAVSSAEIEQACQEDVWRLGTNSLEPVACRLFADVGALVQQMNHVVDTLGLTPLTVRMSGSGGAVFVSCPGPVQAQQVAEALQSVAEPGTQIRVCRQLAQHPARALLQ